MVGRILDTSVLIGFWHRQGGRPADAAQARQWSMEIARVQRTDLIVSPVFLEFVCGSRTRDELELAEAFLSEFEIKDGWNVRPEDIADARRIARRIPRTGKPRQLGDCLIRALANRFRCDVIAYDEGFPGR